MQKKLLLSEYILLSLMAIFYILIFSTTTSPFLGEPFAGDSAMFLTIGKYWAKGHLPYVSLWDSKGPIIFFINAIGYFLTDSNLGVFFLQIIGLIVSEVFLYKIYNIVFEKELSLGLTVVTLAVMLIDYDGNSTEEYLLPLIIIAFYFVVCWIYKYYRENIIEHNPLHAFFYGFTFTFCLLTRLTNAVGLCAAIFVIVIVLSIKQKWINLLKNAVMFIGGALVLLLPFVIYFYLHGILYEALYGTLLYNLDYMGHSSLAYSTSSLYSILQIMIGYSYGIVLCLLGVFEVFILKKRITAGWVWSVVGFLTTLWLFRSNGYLHYGLVAIPYFPIIIVEIKQILFEVEMGKIKEIFLRYITIVYLIICLIGSVFSIKGTLIEYYNTIFVGEVRMCKEAEQEVISMIPESELDSFIAYNTNPGIYLQLDIKPYYRFFTMQDWAASRSQTLEKLLVNTFAEGDVKWVFVEGSPDETLIREVLEDRYMCVANRKKPFVNTMYYLFQLKE